MSLSHSHDPLERRGAHRKEDHVRRRIVTLHERSPAQGVETPQRALIAEDRPTKRVTVEEHRLIFIENQFRRRILVGSDLVQDHLALLLDLGRRELRVCRQIGDQLHRPLEVWRGKDGIEERLLLRRVGIQIAADSLHAVQDVPCPAPEGTLEKHMLHEMRQPTLVRRLVARASVDGQPAISHLRIGRQMDHPQPIGQGVRKRDFFSHQFFVFIGRKSRRRSVAARGATDRRQGLRSFNIHSMQRYRTLPHQGLQ